MCIPGLAPRKYIEKNNGKGQRLLRRSVGPGFLSADPHWPIAVTRRTSRERGDR